MKKLFVFAITIAGVSCSDRAPETDSVKTDSADADTTQMHIQIPESTCYRYATGADTISLKVESFPNVVTGLLRYSLKEKDRNTGEIDGVMKGDTLVADYSFMSEGIRSTRQVVFLIQGDTAVEGYGNMKEQNGRMIFEDIGEVDFSTGMKLTRVPCDY